MVSKNEKTSKAHNAQTLQVHLRQRQGRVQPAAPTAALNAGISEEEAGGGCWSLEVSWFRVRCVNSLFSKDVSSSPCHWGISVLCHVDKYHQVLYNLLYFF